MIIKPASEMKTEDTIKIVEAKAHVKPLEKGRHFFKDSIQISNMLFILSYLLYYLYYVFYYLYIYLPYCLSYHTYILLNILKYILLSILLFIFIPYII